MPILAEIADKMPTVGRMWTTWVFIGLFASVVTAGLSAVRLWLGVVPVGLCVALGLSAAAADGIMDGLIVQELGAGYLFQQRISSFVPCVLAIAAWFLMWSQRRPTRALKRTRALNYAQSCDENSKSVCAQIFE